MDAQLTESDTPVGPRQHVGPAVQWSHTAPHWARPTASDGTHEPEGPA
jgi:hypothetical protein